MSTSPKYVERYNQDVVTALNPKILDGDEVTITAALEQSLGQQAATLLLRAMERSQAPTVVVGGWLRDLVLGRESSDVDLLAANPDALAAQLLEDGASKTVLLDSQRRTWRVVLPGGAYIDISAPRGEGGDALQLDLELRDLRVNAMAWSPRLGFVDPLRGRDDLREGVLRSTSARALSDDPLRALRCWRLAITLNMEVADELLVGMRSLRLDDVSGERSVAELQQILLHDRADTALTGLQESDLLEQLVPGRPRIELLRSCVRRSYDSPALSRCLAAVQQEGDAWTVGLRLGWLLDAPRLKPELLKRRWSRRCARLAAISSTQVTNPEQAPSEFELDADLRRWKDASSVAILGRVAQLSDKKAEELAARYLQVLNGRTLGGALSAGETGR